MEIFIHYFKVINYIFIFERSYKTSVGSPLIATNLAYSTNDMYKTIQVIHGCGSAAFFQYHRALCT
jgi:hypothetical protein